MKAVMSSKEKEATACPFKKVVSYLHFRYPWIMGGAGFLFLMALGLHWTGRGAVGSEPQRVLEQERLLLSEGRLERERGRKRAEQVKRVVSERLDEIRCPVLVIASDQDYVPLADHETWAARLPNAELAVIRDSRHASIVEKPSEVNQALMDFLRRQLREVGS